MKQPQKMAYEDRCKFRHARRESIRQQNREKNAARAAERSKRSNRQQLDKLTREGWVAKKERSRLRALIAAGNP